MNLVLLLHGIFCIIIYCAIMKITLAPSSQVKVSCPRGHRAATPIVPQGTQTPDWPAPICNPVTRPLQRAPLNAPVTLKSNGAMEEIEINKQVTK